MSNIEKLAAAAAKRAKKHRVAKKAIEGYAIPDWPNLRTDNPDYKTLYRAALNYANYAYTDKDLFDMGMKWLKDRKVYKLGMEHTSISGIIQLGKMAWIEKNKGEFSPESEAYRTNFVKAIGDRVKGYAEPKEIKPKVVTVQDRIRQATSDFIAEVDEWLDKEDYVQSPAAYLRTKNKAIHANKAREYYKRQFDEMREVISGKDDSLKEGYASFKKPALKKRFDFLERILTDLAAYAKVKVSTRKPRKTKVKTAAQLVSKVKYKQKDDTFKLTSIAPENVIGAKTFYVFNSKYRTLGMYVAADEIKGLSIKGATIQGFDEAKSIKKKLRKPERWLPVVLTGGKVALRHLFEEIHAVASTLNGRINPETVLLRTLK